MSRETNENLKRISPFAIPTHSYLFGYTHWNEAQKIHRKYKAKTQQKYESKKILVKPDKKAPIQLPVGITDVDPSYFTDIAGRAIKEKFSRRKYIDDIRNILKTKLTTGYYQDYCLRVNQQFSEEQNALEAIKKNYHQHLNLFEEYLSQDNEDTVKVIEKAQEASQNNRKLMAKRDQLLKEVGQVSLKVYHWRKIGILSKICHEFVRKMSSSHLHTLEKHESLNNSINNPNSDDQVLSKSSLECLVDAFQKDITDNHLGSPEDITLEDPRELSQIFNAIEVRNLDALIYLESLARPMEELTSNITKAENLIKEEISIIEESLEEIKSLIKSSQQRVTDLKVYEDYLLHQVFRDLVCSEAVLQLYVFIEDAYESCIGPNTTNMNAYAMMQAIEKTYESLNVVLDSLPPKIVAECEKEGFAQEIKKIREAEDAARKFELMHRLLAALERIMVRSEMSLQPKSKDKSTLHTRQIKPSSSISSVDFMKVKKLQLKELTMPRRYREFSMEDYKSMEDLNISNLTFKMNKSSQDNAPKETVATDDNHDCRDEIV
ncbi:LOW QUALITY PROTEIN: uncharacterized protein [Chelonus insularis]|uniref:LOW QUALITY PROTEIN: uncharacterized protein n=1 Tax=Chelonus insularis TaxID=460826 RepID=UPI00158B831A|nr:LOW QUALITY PROTEIN: uncharacterized protein LOC118065512 [Chelonus insularis]